MEIVFEFLKENALAFVLAGLTMAVFVHSKKIRHILRLLDALAASLEDLVKFLGEIENQMGSGENNDKKQ